MPRSPPIEPAALTLSFHQDHLDLVEEIEHRFPVSAWKSGDAGIWPLARMDLYVDMYHQSLGGPGAGGPARPLRALEQLSRPVSNIWKQRRDLRHHMLRPRPAGAIFLGDGVSLELIDGRWEDRYCEPLISALDDSGVGSFLMQAGTMRRTPWRRPTFAANIVDAAGSALAPFRGAPLALPGAVEFAQFLAKRGVCAPSLAPEKLARRGARLLATTAVFERILQAVRPRLAFAVTWYAGLGPAFLLACRRQGVLSIDLQHCPQGGRHKAYRWSAVSERGYGVLPAIFWSWSEEDAAHIASWTRGPWHRSLHGGDPRLAPFLDDADPRTRRWDVAFRQVAGPQTVERDILVALQTTGGQDRVWNDLAGRIAAAPPGWRWWIRRHPAARRENDAAYARLLALRGPNIRIEEASALPLPALLRHMSAVISVASGVAAEAVAFGVPAIFLSGDASGPFGDLTESGHARIAETICEIPAMIAALPRFPPRPAARRQPDLRATLNRLDGMAIDYARLCCGG